LVGEVLGTSAKQSSVSAPEVEVEERSEVAIVAFLPAGSERLPVERPTCGRDDGVDDLYLHRERLGLLEKMPVP